MKKVSKEKINPLKIKKNIFLPLIFFALLGLTVSILITKLNYDIEKLNSHESSFCHVSEFLDCDKALVSPYAKVGPFFTSELGIFYYLFLTLGFLFVWRRQRSRHQAT